MAPDGPSLTLHAPIARRPWRLDNRASSSSDDGTATIDSPGGTFGHGNAVADGNEGSTLYGIYGRAAWGDDNRDTNEIEHSNGSTPTTPSQTSLLRRLNVDAGDYTSRKRAEQILKEIYIREELYASSMSPSTRLLALAARALLLFVLGVGYGIVIRKWGGSPAQETFTSQYTFSAHGFGWPHVILWGLFGVGFGSMIPLFDSFLESRRPEKKGIPPRRLESPLPPKEETHVSNWMLVVRGVAGPVGVAYGVWKIPWASTLQVSVVLVAATLMLWYLIDRTGPSLYLSAAVGLISSSAIMCVNSVLPSPTPSYLGIPHINSSRGVFDGQPGSRGLSGASRDGLGRGAWLFSVLFFTCLCFGNIGRRLSLDRSAQGRGRWGGM